MSKVIGAGVAGMACAIKLAQAGENVTVYDQFDFIGKAEGGENVQAVRNYDLSYDQLQYWKDNKLNLNNLKPIYKIIKYVPSGKSMEIYSEIPLFYVFKRGMEKITLDHQLYECAISEGVKFAFSERKHLLNGDFIAVNPIYKNIWAFGYEYSGVNIDPQTILFFMDNNYCPNGYIYLIPYGKHEVSIASTSYNLSAPLPILLNKFIAENKIVNSVINGGILTSKFAGGTYSNIPRTAELNGKKFIGCAAGFLDPARGFGVKYAIDSAILAAKSFTSGESYDSLWKKMFEKELIEGFKRRLMLENMNNDGYEQLIIQEKVKINEYNKSPGTLEKIYKEMEFLVALEEWRKKYDLSKLFGK